MNLGLTFSCTAQRCNILVKGLLLSLVCLLMPGCINHTSSCENNGLMAKASAGCSKMASVVGVSIAVYSVIEDSLVPGQTLARMRQYPADRKNVPLLPLPLPENDNDTQVHDVHDDEENLLCVQIHALMRLAIMMIMLGVVLL